MKYVIEFEGFLLPRGFVFKEITICNIKCTEDPTYFQKHFFIKPPCHFNSLTVHEKRIVKYCENKLHKIYWFAGRDKFNSVLAYLSTLNDATVYTKGLQKANVLKNLGFNWTVINTEDLLVENTEDCSENLPIQDSIECPLSFHIDNAQCSHAKALKILNDLSSYMRNESLPKSEPLVSEETCDMQGVEEEEDHSGSIPGRDTSTK